MTTGEKTIDVETMIGKVTTVSGKGTGWKMDFCPGDWFNVSQWGEAVTKPLPAVGELIEVDVTAARRGGYWVADWRSVEPVEGEGPPTLEQVLSRAVLREPEPRRDDKPVVTRLACLNAAVASLKGSPQNQPGLSFYDEYCQSVLGLAERFVAWATWGGHGATVAGSDVEESLPNPEPAGSESTVSTGRRKST